MGTRKATARELTNKSCRQITNLIYDYLNGRLSPTVKKDLDRHLRVCPDCVAFLKTYKKTVAVAAALRCEEMPEIVLSNFLKFLQTRARRTKSSS